ncbi:MAG: YhfC family glutamic-type intramembrane protease [Anaerolineaceae bacterium]
MINWALLASYLLSLIVMIGLPILLAFVVVKRFHVSWWVILTGVGTFIVSQVVHFPALAGVNALFSKGILPIPAANWQPLVNGVIVGLLAGICEETARWAGFKILKNKAKPFGSALGLGVGHGGAESIILAVLGTGITLGTVLLYNAGHQIASGTAAATVQNMLSQIAAFWGQPFYAGLLPGLERIIAISTQILLSILVWRAVVERNFWWFLLAILYHAIVDAVGVFLLQNGMASYLVEGVLFLFFLLNIYLIYSFIRDETEAEEEEDEEGAEGEDEEEEEGEAKDIEDEEEEELSEPESSLDEPESPDEDKPGQEEIGK